jgi:hypothetical protein
MSGDHEEHEAVDHLRALEAKAVREEEALEETLGEIRHEIEEIETHEADEHKPFLITVNHKDVPLIGHDHTGLQIKQAAIGAGVRIELDFVLSEELSHGRSRIIGDDQRIRVEAGACFEAIPNDDHS